jgi:hypothetical protein
MAFKRMKGILELDALPAKEPLLSRMIIYAKLLAASISQMKSLVLSMSAWYFARARFLSFLELGDVADGGQQVGLFATLVAQYRDGALDGDFLA